MTERTAKARILIRATPAEIFDAFIDPATMSRFWFCRRDHGLTSGADVLWYVGNDVQAMAITVRVVELQQPERIVIDWGVGGAFTRVVWTISARSAEQSILQIEESGFPGSEDQQLSRVIDSTAGFNQVVVAVKALLESGCAMNIVADHG